MNTHRAGKRLPYQSTRAKGSRGVEGLPETAGANRRKAQSTRNNALVRGEQKIVEQLKPEVARSVSEQVEKIVFSLKHSGASDAAVLAALYFAWEGKGLQVKETHLADVATHVSRAIKEALTSLCKQYGSLELTGDGEEIEHYGGAYVPFCNELRASLMKLLQDSNSNLGEECEARLQRPAGERYADQKKATLSALQILFADAEKNLSASLAAAREDATKFIIRNLPDRSILTLLDVIDLILNGSSESKDLQIFTSELDQLKMDSANRPNGNWLAFKMALLAAASESLPERLRASCPKVDDPSVDEAIKQRQLKAWVQKARVAEIAKSMVRVEMQATPTVRRGQYQLRKGEWLVVPQLETEAPAVLCLNAALKERLNDKQSLPLMEVTDDGKRTSTVSWRVFREGDCVPNMQLDPFYGSLDRSIVDAEFSRLQRFNIDKSFCEESKIPRGSDLQTLLNEKKTLILTVHHPLPFVASTAGQIPAVFHASEKPGAAEISLEQLIAEALDKKLSH